MRNLRAIINLCFVICLFTITSCTSDSFQERMTKQAQCIPPPFLATQSLAPTEENYRQVDINESFQKISEYYLDLLTPVDAKDTSKNYVNGVWRVQELGETESGKLFDCYNSIDRFTKETGCIYLHVKSDEETTIEYIWNLGELAPGCSSLLNQ